MPQTLLYGSLETEVTGAAADRDRLWIPLDELERSTGWTAKPEGLCRGEICVPVPAGATWLDGAARRVDFAAFAAHLGHAAARDDERGIWAFGPAADRGAAGGSGPVVAPDFQLPDLDGNLHSLSGYRGKKVLLYCWSSW
ncbi:MAG: redoxin domain-containing protein [Deltaproteobacteria bacterium]|nr:MAG: redoxin domain-containing protein [Deltaproteobacteria bacterium]TMQ11481.1 MAG: redoxin domain-containing protein [Deltaproteobacteria bacterium]